MHWPLLSGSVSLLQSFDLHLQCTDVILPAKQGPLFTYQPITHLSLKLRSALYNQCKDIVLIHYWYKIPLPEIHDALTLNHMLQTA